MSAIPSVRGEEQGCISVREAFDRESATSNSSILIMGIFVIGLVSRRRLDRGKTFDRFSQS